MMSFHIGFVVHANSTLLTLQFLFITMSQYVSSENMFLHKLFMANSAGKFIFSIQTSVHVFFPVHFLVESLKREIFEKKNFKSKTVSTNLRTVGALKRLQSTISSIIWSSFQVNFLVMVF